MVEIIEVTTTLESESQAQQLGHLIVMQRLAACVQITGPIQSIYRWQGQICEATEWRCTMKSTLERKEPLIESLRKNHPYEVAEILVTGVDDATDEYCEWIVQQVS